MYGIPNDIDLSEFVGLRLDALTIAKYAVYFDFECDVSITIESSYAYNEAIVDVSEGKPVHHSPLLELIGHQVIEAVRVSSASIMFRFALAKQLEVFDSSSQYESFIIKLGEKRIIV